MEICFPIDKRKFRERILDDLNTYLADNQQAWLLQANGEYVRASREPGEPACSAQEILLDRLAATL